MRDLASWLWIKFKEGGDAVLSSVVISVILVFCSPFIIFQWLDERLDKRPKSYREEI